MDSYANTAISFGDIRESLLYFDYVVPCYAALNIMNQVSDVDYAAAQTLEGHKLTLNPDETLNHLRGKYNKYLPPKLRHDDQFLQLLKTIDIHAFFRDAEIRRLNIKEELLFPTPGLGSMEALNHLFYVLKRHYVPEHTYLDLPPHISFGEQQEICPFVVVTNMRLIDAHSVSLAMIEEFRKDDESMNKMRAFRLFVYDAFTGQSPALIQDSMLSKLADYNQVIKDWQFETRQQEMGFLVDEKY